MRLRDYQTDCVKAIHEEWIFNNSVLAVLATGLGKAQQVTEPVLTPWGWEAIGELSVGDLVIGADGKATEVRGVFPQGEKLVYSVRFSDGEEVLACGEHLWAVQTRSQKSRGDGFAQRTTQQLLADLRDGSGARKWFVPIVQPVEFFQHDHPLDPWLLGFLVGDGSFAHGSVGFSSADPELVERVLQIAARDRLRVHQDSAYDYRITHGVRKKRNVIMDDLRRLGLAGCCSDAKFIPSTFMLGSSAQRLELLRGLMDSDGTVSPIGHGCEFNTVSRRLAYDVADLVRSLGGVTRVRMRGGCSYQHAGELRVGRESYRVAVDIPANPFSLSRKAERYSRRKYRPIKAIDAIEPVGREECRCISVANSDGLYVTRGYTITHNTVIFSEIVRRWTRGRCLIIVPAIELIHQAAEKVVAATGTMPAIEQGNNRSDESSFYRSPFVIGSKQTLTGKSKRYQRLAEISLVVVDEAHGATTALYKEMLDHYVAQGAQVLGVTATPKRHDGLALGNIFEKCAYQLDICDAVPKGWLVPARAQCIQLQSLDLSKVAVSKSGEGDFKESELAKVMEEEKVVFEIAEVVARESENLKTAVFCASVLEARAVAELLVDRYGKRADWVCGDKQLCDDVRRKEVLDSFTGDPDGVQIVCNVGVLTTGWDFPGLEHIVVARPTRSLSLYTQIFGRGTRALPGVVDFEGSDPDLRRAAIANSAKPHFKMTDLRDNSLEHKLITAVDVLGGTMGIEVINRAKSAVNKAGGPVDLESVLSESRRAEEEKERRRRAAVEARAQYKKVDVDPFNGFERGSVDMKKSDKGPRMMFGKYKGKPLATVPGGYLNWLLNSGNMRDGWLKNAITKELQTRKATA